ncbi:hypothetical protein PIB30_011540 [Stylosanthes scabra]|uniref:Uncharacterized protein n=1 Tax=Stylosanthes scabra TaxID=79078 RepID=A0ABU6T7Y6_9FABA|nr:hypothetical protein [Stylosanthes scabra]
MTLSRVDPMINVMALLFGSEEDLGRSAAFGQRKGGQLWDWAMRAQHSEQLPRARNVRESDLFEKLLDHDV